MESIGAFDAKTRLSELLDRAAKGESFRITKHGHAVARLIPENARDVERARAAVARLKALRGSIKDRSVEQLKGDAHEGHRF